MMPAVEELLCAECGARHTCEGLRRCRRCDRPLCPHSEAAGKETLCSECRSGRMPAHIEPMLAEAGAMPADPGEWGFEYKWDGMRALAYWQRGKLRLESRTLRDVTAQYPDLVPKRDAGRRGAFLLDGEIVALDGRARPSFGLLQKRMHASAQTARRICAAVPVQYFAFDVLWHGGQALLGRPYAERRATLEALALPHAAWRVPGSHAGEGAAMLRVARSKGIEGLVSKRLTSPYRPGVRSRDWIKIKVVRRQEFVIGGWEPRRQSEREIASLLVGYYAPDALGLVFAGRVGTGFDDETHARLVPLLRAAERRESPFAGRVGKRGTRFTAPALVAEVAYRRWPPGGALQQASFLGLRSDVPPHQVVREDRGKG